MTEVRFLLGFVSHPDADELAYIDGEDLLAEPDRFHEVLQQTTFGFEPGALSISVGDDQTRLEDALAFLVLGLCFRAVPPILAGEQFTYQYFDDGASSAHLLVNDEVVNVSGRHAAPLVCPRWDLAESLYACGMRYLHMRQHLHVAEEASVQDLVAAAASAQAALASRLRRPSHE